MPEGREDRSSDSYAEGTGDSVQIAQDADLRSVMAVAVGQGREDAPCWPLVAPVRKDPPLQVIVGQRCEIVCQKSVPCSSVLIEAATSPGISNVIHVSSRGPKAHS